MRRLPGAWTSPRRTGREPVPTSTAWRPACSSPGARSGGASGPPRRGRVEGSEVQGDGAELEADAVELGPGARVGGARADLPVHHVRGPLPVDLRVRRSDLGGEAHALGRLRDGMDRPVLDPVERRDEEFGPGTREPAEQRAGRVVGPDRLGQHPVHRARVQLLDEQERAGAGHVVAVQDGVLDRCGATPGRQDGEVQVDPAVRRDVQRGLRQQGPVRGHRAAVRADLVQPGEELRVTGPGRGEHLEPRLRGALGDRAGLDLAAAAGRGVGPGHHRGDLVPGRQQRVKRRYRRLRRTRENQAHQRSRTDR